MSDSAGILSGNHTIPCVVEHAPVTEHDQSQRTHEAHEVHEHQKGPCCQVPTDVVERTASSEP